MPKFTWQKSSFSSTGSNCVNVAISSEGSIHLRESDRPEAIVTTTVARLDDLLSRIKSGDVDQP